MRTVNAKPIIDEPLTDTILTKEEIIPSPTITNIVEPLIKTDVLSKEVIITLPIIIRILRQKMQGEDVRALQVYLNTHNYPVSLIESGSLGNETTYFGSKTKASVIKFQLANNLVGDGIVGRLTREKMK